MSENVSEIETTENCAENETRTIAFDYLKSHQFRVIQVNGAIGGVSGRGELVMTLWNECKAIPQRTIQKINPDGEIGDELIDERVGRDAMVRELEVCAMMSLETAEVVAKWILKHVSDHRSLVAALKQQKQGCERTETGGEKD